MKDLVDILKITLPSLIMLAALYCMVRGYFRNSEKQRKLKIVCNSQKLITPIRLQAYERLVLFLERISPESLVMRMNYPSKTSAEMHTELLHTIRSEFEHNLSQQLYVSVEAWKSVRNAKNTAMSFINSAAAEVEGTTPAIKLSRKILDRAVELDQPVCEKAINELKREIQQIF